MDAQDAQDNQVGTLLREKPAPAIIVCGIADAQDYKLVCRLRSAFTVIPPEVQLNSMS